MSQTLMSLKLVWLIEISKAGKDSINCKGESCCIDYFDGLITQQQMNHVLTSLLGPSCIKFLKAIAVILHKSTIYSEIFLFV